MAKGEGGRGLTGDVVQHAQPKQWIGKTQDSSSDNRGPVGGLAIAGESEPEEGDGEEPDGDQGGKETGLRAIVAVDLTVTGVEPGLHGNECEHDQDPDDEVEVGEIGRDITAAC